MEERLKNIESKVDKIYSALAGDGLGNPGLIEDHRKLKGEFYQTKGRVDRAWWAAGVIGTIAGAVVTLLSKLFDK